MKTYVKFTEHNDWEGETWHFYIPIQGNELTLDRIGELINGNEFYELKRKKEYTEQEVDFLCGEEGSTTYMNQHNKVKSINKLPLVVDFEIDDPFYKGSPWELEELGDE